VAASELADRIRALALSFPEAYEDEPWGHPVFKVQVQKGSVGTGEGRPSRDPMFAGMSVDADAVRLTVKLTAEEREIAELLPYVSKARYVGRYGWVTAEVADEESLACALEWLRESYWLRAPAQLREAAWSV
jgi:hypothetical protein